MRASSLATLFCILAVALLVFGNVRRAAAVDDPPADVREEIRRLKQENERSRKRIDELEQKLEQAEERQQRKEKELVDKAEKAEKAAADGSRRYLERYWGDGRFVVTGWGATSFEWQKNANANTFLATLSPIFLYRVTDRVLFEAEPEFELTEGGDTEVNLEYGQADVFLNDYMTFVGGKYLLPFGQFIQQLHPAWINKLVSFPLPYREAGEGGIMPFSDVGVQLRGGVPLGLEGTNVDYTLFMGNGPKFESEDPGALFKANNVDSNRGKGYGARIGFSHQPAESPFGTLSIGASTFDGKWDDNGNLWFTSWGVDAAYRLEELELRGEYLETRREMPQGAPRDRREGWYAQGSYKLSRLGVPHLDRAELVARYSGVNRPSSGEPTQEGAPGILTAEQTEGEPLLPRPRQVALGFDYWLTPSVVAKFEYDREIPRGAENDHAIRAQFAVGF